MRTPGVIDVYCEQPWYVARPEPEEEFVGTLEAMQTITGPGNRPSLAFLLRTADDELPVYASGVVDTLGPLDRTTAADPWQGRRPHR